MRPAVGARVLANVGTCQIGHPDLVFYEASLLLLSTEPLHLFVPVGASCVIWESEISYSAEVSTQTLTYVAFAELQNLT